MPIKYTNIRTHRQWRASTGLSKEQFEKLVLLFEEAYIDLFGEGIETRQNNSTIKSRFTNYSDYLFFGLYSIKSGLTYDLLGLSFDLSPSNAHSNQATCLAVLQAALIKGEYMPKREYRTEKEFVEHWKKEGSMMIDATEQRRQRPGNQEDQKADYSGKKKDIR